MAEVDVNFKIETLPLQDDFEGEVVASLIVAPDNTGNRKSILYLHGYVDYFFQSHVAEQFNKSGYDFFALDLRKHGRSLLHHQRPNFCKDLKVYFEEIDLAIRKIKKSMRDDLFLMGHSTGGLISAFYMNEGNARQEVKALILNAPFLDFNQSPFIRFLSRHLARLLSKLVPGMSIKGTIPPAYGKSLHKNYFGEWDYNPEWKPVEGFPTWLVWVNAVGKAHQSIKHSQIQVPVLVIHAAKSVRIFKYREVAQVSDVILNVADIRRIAPHLGSDVKMVEIENAVHDVFLSVKPSREKAFQAVFKWLNEIS